MKKSKIVKTERFRTHAIFLCGTCGKEWQNHWTSRKEAYQHAKETGHKVSGEVGTSYHYNF